MESFKAFCISFIFVAFSPVHYAAFHHAFSRPICCNLYTDISTSTCCYWNETVSFQMSYTYQLFFEINTFIWQRTLPLQLKPLILRRRLFCIICISKLVKSKELEKMCAAQRRYHRLHWRLTLNVHYQRRKSNRTCNMLK